VSAGIWWTAIPPGTAIVLTILGMTLIGESLNDLADPRLRARRRAGKQTAADAVASSQPVTREFMGEVE
jgi:peptide/nickel transport system permease protein